MYWYLIVVRNGQHFFATRHYFERPFVIKLAEQLHELMPDAIIKLEHGCETITETALYGGKDE